VEARSELVACGTDLVGVRGGDDRLRDVVRAVVLELVEPDLGPLRDDIEGCAT